MVFGLGRHVSKPSKLQLNSRSSPRLPWVHSLMHASRCIELGLLRVVFWAVMYQRFFRVNEATLATLPIILCLGFGVLTRPPLVKSPALTRLVLDLAIAVDAHAPRPSVGLPKCPRSISNPCFSKCKVTNKPIKNYARI